jgi:quercetin dioxygenase-like cupin family protein
MRPTLFVAAALSFIIVPVTAEAQQPGAAVRDAGPAHHLVFRPGDIDWQDGPASFQPGAQFAVLEGNPGEAGVFTMRIRMPDGFVIAPHWHPNVERVTVVSGVFLLGKGDVLDRQATERLGAGSYTSLPPETRHFAIAEGETVIQLTSVGPWQINYVNPEDDPRRQQR